MPQKTFLKKTEPLAKGLLFLSLFFATASAQVQHTFPALDTANTFTGQNVFPGAGFGMTIPLPSGVPNGFLVVAKNGISSADCTVGGGTFYVICISQNGTWIPGAGSGNGTLTGVITGANSGLIGGGFTGTLTMALTNTCANNQILQWNGVGWICS